MCLLFLLNLLSLFTCKNNPPLPHSEAYFLSMKAPSDPNSAHVSVLQLKKLNLRPYWGTIFMTHTSDRVHTASFTPPAADWFLLFVPQYGEEKVSRAALASE